MKNLFCTVAVASALFLAACDTPQITEAPVTKAPASAPAQARTLLYAHALWGDPVFDNDVITFQRALARYTPLSEVEAFGYTSWQLESPTGPVVTDALNDLAAKAVDGRDVVVVMFTTHGAPDILAQKPAGSEDVISIRAEALRQFLSPLENDLQIIVIQACYSGSLIDDLASPNRIILTAAAADKTSFGCNPDNDNTWYIKSLNAALSEGGSWEDINRRASRSVTEFEASQGIPPQHSSNPQAFVGANMEEIWSTGSIQIPAPPEA